MGATLDIRDRGQECMKKLLELKKYKTWYTYFCISGDYKPPAASGGHLYEKGTFVWEVP